MKYEIVIPKGGPKRELNCPFDFTSRCTMGRCDCKPKQETLEGYEEALNQFPEYNQYLERIAFEKGVEWQAERSYNEEELRKIVKYAFNAGQRAESGKISKDFTLNRYLNSLKRNNGKKNK